MGGKLNPTGTSGPQECFLVIAIALAPNSLYCLPCLYRHRWMADLVKTEWISGAA
jgi:hypothetical protein